MNTAALSAAFNAHKPAVLGTAAAAVAGLALLQKRKKTTGPAATSTGGATVPGTIPAAAVVSGSGYDSSAADVANWLSPQLEQILQTTSRSGITSAPAPVASNLFAPSYSGNYVRFADGLVSEVESDGSLYALSQAEHSKAFAANGGDYHGLVNELGERAPTSGVYSTGGNLLLHNAAQQATG